jgi:hypothetical protein
MFLLDRIKYHLFTPPSEALLEQYVEDNYEHIFGEHSFYFSKKKIKSKAGIGVIPDSFVIFFNPKPTWCVLEIELSSHPLYEHIFPQITKFKRAAEDNTSKKNLIRFFYDSILANPLLEAKFKQKIGSGEIYKSISDMIEDKKPLFVVIIDQKTDELEEVLLDLGDNVRVIEFKTYQREGTEAIIAFSFQPIMKLQNYTEEKFDTPREDKESYKRGQLKKAVFELFDDKGVDTVSYNECEKLALSIKPDSKFNTSHFSWYKNNYQKTKAIQEQGAKRYQYTILGQSCSAQNAREVLTGVLEKLSGEDSTFIERFSDSSIEHGKKRRYVSRHREELYPDRPDLCASSALQLKNGFWVGTNYNTSSIKQIIRLATEVAGLKYGQDVKDNL